VVAVQYQWRGSSFSSAQIGSLCASVDLQARLAAAKPNVIELDIRCRFSAVMETRSPSLVTGSVVAPTAATYSR